LIFRCFQNLSVNFFDAPTIKKVPGTFRADHRCAKLARMIRLTQTVKKGGCAAKVAATELREILANVRFPPVMPELTVDGRDFDDAAIYRISDSVSIVQTIDFFTPILDSPYDFGRVAAANAISDVYAMGGRPLTALAVLAFPLGELPNSVIAEVMQGACDVLTKAGAALAGGHSIDDDTLKFGLSVTGTVHPDRVWANTGATVGDVLILTKGLGTGALTAALKREALTEAEIAHAVESMSTLNNAIDHLEPASLATAVHAATDITGFGLAGHAMQMAKASGVSFSFRMGDIPRLARAEECLEKGFLTKAHKSNRNYTADFVRPEGLTEIEELLLYDPQTSGGLLLSVAPEKAKSILEVLRVSFPLARAVGVVMAGDAGVLRIGAGVSA
jgi:selenide, water dikinase